MSKPILAAICLTLLILFIVGFGIFLHHQARREINERYHIAVFCHNKQKKHIHPSTHSSTPNTPMTKKGDHSDVV